MTFDWEGRAMNEAVKKLNIEWLNKLTVRYAEAQKTLMQAQPYLGDKKLLLAHDLYLIARDYRGHIEALEADLADARRKGAEEMRKRAIAQISRACHCNFQEGHESWCPIVAIRAIRALPLDADKWKEILEMAVKSAEDSEGRII